MKHEALRHEQLIPGLQ